MTEQPERSTEPEHTPGYAAQTNIATDVIAYLLAGPLLFGGLGFLLDRWLELTFFVVIGLLAGMALSMYVIWNRYGTS
ncbi:AtpZ/AtpI family protein [Ornithinimicrobium sp. F0845]|uniref:AtpZ/AtpI family protein n=1 Tax=Ornithinimicrobium sp. F0845 TaxID=2926412 RepID=UPI001FF5027D|nr:AtpZ/AtpI family protein [Ornithinimicrobium sp. F0845]MCK0112328.1 AtpZ/AtpI family protein [Ornithinimicrobium sp. F0845]